MHVVVIHHSEENIDRVKRSRLKLPLLYIFLLSHCQKKLKLNCPKINCYQIHIIELTFCFSIFTFYLHFMR